ncbi:decaprenyl-diphosphate synthase subunit 1 [Fistulifera solaris]|uniref:Decaprenyl-diphosphate synthase subunit 1 n=1 Tax=Fistulifera solaris TaxID=1519565 RepID=A0A1Z5KE75_FISSO|nr:decaprenyl-diphosphate synthase subunit 1 [Fistulifera solaris]|eukprot:GAX24630.1 decaprenyl-diphosphate synthase subunit 1 [Fistulifera solaris]
MNSTAKRILASSNRANGRVLCRSRLNNVHRCNLLQQQRSLASSVGLSVPEGFKDTVKKTILDHALREDSRLWQSTGDDPLDDLDLEFETTRYWPSLPPGVETIDPIAISSKEIVKLVESIRDDMLNTEHPVLQKAATYFFQSAADGGKKVRPMLVLLLSRALSDHIATAHQPVTSSSLLPPALEWQRPELPDLNRRLAEVTEIFHTASLLHDDVLDDADQRRNLPALHTQFGAKIAVLAGDFLLAKACVTLAKMGDLRTVQAMSTVLEHLVLGEVMQIRGPKADGQKSRLRVYLKKNFYKTASLMALSCKSVGFLGEYPDELIDVAYRFGKHAGMAFQLVDDALDYEGTAQHLGKPSMADLRSGLATAPVLFAAQEHTELIPMIDRKFKGNGDVERAIEIVFRSDGIERTKELAILHAERAMDALLELNPSPSRDALIQLAYRVVARTR